MRPGAPYIFKPGRSEDVVQRSRQYPKGSRTLCVLPVSGNGKDAEDAVLAAFGRKFVQRRDVGTEYFQVCDAKSLDHAVSMALAVFYGATFPYVHVDALVEPEHEVRRATATDGHQAQEADQQGGVADGGRGASVTMPAVQVPDTPSRSPPGTAAASEDDGSDDAEQEVATPTGSAIVQVAAPVMCITPDLMAQQFMDVYMVENAGCTVPVAKLYSDFVRWMQAHSENVKPTSCARLLTAIRTLYGLCSDTSCPPALVLPKRHSDAGSDPDAAVRAHAQFPEMVQWLEHHLNFQPARTPANKGKKLYAWISKKAMVERMWSHFNEPAKGTGHTKTDLTRLLVSVMGMKQRPCKSIQPTDPETGRQRPAVIAFKNVQFKAADV